MSIIGKWKSSEVRVYDDEASKFVFKPVDQYIKEEAERDNDVSDMFRSYYDIRNDGFIYICQPIPEGVSEEELKEALDSGAVTLCDDGNVCLEKKPWKEEDGKIKYDTGVHGEVLGEEISPWDEIKVLDDGRLEIMFTILERFE